MTENISTLLLGQKCDLNLRMKSGQMLIGNFASPGVVLLKPNINSAACALMSDNYEDIQSAICKLMRAAMKTAN